MKVGDIFRYRHNGKHQDVILIILQDYNQNKRFVYNIDYDVRVGEGALLYAKHLGRANAEKILLYTKKAKAIKN